MTQGLGILTESDTSRKGRCYHVASDSSNLPWTAVGDLSKAPSVEWFLEGRRGSLVFPLEPDPSNILKSQENIAEMPVQLSPIAASRSSERRHSGPDGAPTPPIAHLEVASTLTGQGIGPTLMAKMTLARRIPL